MNVSSVKNLNGEVFSAVQDASLTNVVQTNSGNWQDITAYQSNSASYLTAHQDLSDYQTTAGMVDYATTAEVDTLSSMLSGAIDYVSANAGDEFPVSADEAIQYVQTNSGTIDDTVTSYQTNSGTYLTAHQAISADEWNDCYDNVNTNSGAWGGEALPITGRDGIDLEIDNGTLYIGASALSGAIDYVSANVNGYNETVLWEGDASAFSLSEAATGFDNLQITYYPTEGGTSCSTVMYVPSTATSINLFSEYIKVTNDFIIEDVTKFITNDYINYSYGAGAHAWYSTLMERQGGAGGDCFNRVTKVVGILRKPLVSNTYTAEYVGNAADYMSTSNTEYSIELQPNTYNIQYSAHFELGMAWKYNCGIGLYKSTEPNESENVYSASYSAVSEDTRIVDMSGTLEIDTSIGYDRFYPLRDSSNVFGEVSATITAKCYV